MSRDIVIPGIEAFLLLYGNFFYLEVARQLTSLRGRALYKREVKHKKYNKRRAEIRLGGSKPSDDVFRTKTADSTTSYGKTVVESGRKIKSYSMSCLGGPIMPRFAAECCRIWRSGQKNTARAYIV